MLQAPYALGDGLTSNHGITASGERVQEGRTKAARSFRLAVFASAPIITSEGPMFEIRLDPRIRRVLHVVLQLGTSDAQ